MAKNNHNAGMHFVHHANPGKYDDLSYYEKNSEQGLRNKRYEAIAVLEELGDYLFTKYVCSIRILVQNDRYEHMTSYRVLVYEAENENKLIRVTTKRKIYEVGKNPKEEIIVRIHDRQKVIYISSNLYEMGKIRNSAEYRIV